MNSFISVSCGTVQPHHIAVTVSTCPCRPWKKESWMKPQRRSKGERGVVMSMETR